MKPHQTSYRFCLEPDAPIATLEQVLAIVRRLDLELRALRTTATPGGVEVLLRLAGQDPEPLTLCRMRLHNLVGVLPIRDRAHVRIVVSDADNVAMQAGRWTISWQMADTGAANFADEQIIGRAIFVAVTAGGGTAAI